MSSRYRISTLLLFVVLTLVPMSVPRPTVAFAQAYVPEAVECEMLAGINAYRVANGRSSLKLSVSLGQAAEFHSRDMADSGTFSHTLSDGSSWADNIAAHGYPTQSARAENLAATHPTAGATLKQWKESPGHNANMLDPRFNAIGIGRVSDADSQYQHYWTTTFGSVVDTAVACPGYVEPAATAGQRLTIVGGGRTGLSQPSSRLYDGSTTTVWVTTWDVPRSAGYVYLDLGGVKQVGTIEWMFARGGFSDRFSVQVSSDKRTWTTLTTRKTAYAGTWRSLAHTGQTRYVRFYFENPNRDAQVGQLAEVRIYS